MNIPSAYELIRREKIEEIGAEATVLRHRKSGAHLILMDCADTNKVFSIAFRTPPENDTGVPHILEHSVLCGSERFPCRDPFVELAKGSMNTFLNAMTFPEKTLYPVASCNDQDFRNLMAVYMDAVFCPNIYRNEKIFRQEGWHYELEDPEDGITVNGVVYNEMKGAFSDPDGVLDRFTQTVLFPDTPYAFESGGIPAKIPELTQEEFLNFHRRHYHPSNSYIYLYGSMDYEERLNWLDEHYLGSREASGEDFAIPLQKPFDSPVRAEMSYGVAAGEEENAGILSWNRVVGGLMDPVVNLAYEVLGYALLNAPGAPVRQAILGSGIGMDVYGGYDSSIRQPLFSVVAKGADPARLDEFSEIVEREIRKSAEDGIPKRTLFAGINNIEFSMREADFGRYPRGLVYGMQIYDTWIHDEDKAFIHLKYNDSFRKLRELAETDYFEKLIKEGLLDNPHGALILVKPEAGREAKMEAEAKKRLAALKSSLTEVELRKMICDTTELKAYQEAPATPEELNSVPMISVKDIRRNVSPLVNEEREVGGIRTVFHDIETSGISYFDLYIPAERIATEDLPKLALLKNLFTLLDTEHYGYGELCDEVGIHTGGIGCDVSTHADIRDHRNVRDHFCIRGKMLYSETGEAVRLLREIFFGTKFDDTDRIREIIGELLSSMRDDLVNAGHSTALKRVLSYSSALAAEDDLIGGIGFHDYLEDLHAHYDERRAELPEKMRALVKQLFVRNGMILSYTGKEEGFRLFAEKMPEFLGMFPEEEREAQPRKWDLTGKNEGFKSSSQVQYVAVGGNFRDAGHRFSGSMRVLKTLMGYEYLWNRIRVQGGAYGCMSMFGRNGEMAFVSYRDPNLKETLDVYQGIPDYLEKLDISDRDMEKYIIGTVSESDYPMMPNARGRRSFIAWLTGLKEEDLQRERDQVLNCTAQDLRNLAPVVRSVLDQGHLCAVGSEEKIASSGSLFRAVKQLTGNREDAEFTPDEEDEEFTPGGEEDEEFTPGGEEDDFAPDSEAEGSAPGGEE